MTDRSAILQRNEGVAIAYRHRIGHGHGVVFCPGFKSDMAGTKAETLDAFCAAGGRQYTRFDYQGHGESSGDFADGTIGTWLDDTLAIIDQVAKGPQILVGSSMGGWIALLVARARPERIAGLVLIAPAADFTERMWQRLDAPTRRLLETEGVWVRPSEYDPAGYPITMRLIDEGRRHLLLPGPIPFHGPVRILHGIRDDAVPWRRSLEVAEALASEDVEITFVKNGDHRLSEPKDLRRLERSLAEVAERLIGC